MAQHKIVDLEEYRRARRPAAEVSAPPVPGVVWVPVWLMVPAWKPF